MKQFIKTLVTLVIVGSLVQPAQAQTLILTPKAPSSSPARTSNRTPKFEPKLSAADQSLEARALQETTKNLLLDKMDPADQSRMLTHAEQQNTPATFEPSESVPTTSAYQEYLQFITDSMQSGWDYLISMPTPVEGAEWDGYLTTENACNVAVKTAVVAAVSYVAYRLFFKKKETKKQTQEASIKFC